MKKKKFFNPTINENQASQLAFDGISCLQKEGLGIDDIITITSLMLTILCCSKDKLEYMRDGESLVIVCKGIIQSAGIIKKEDAENILSTIKQVKTK